MNVRVLDFETCLFRPGVMAPEAVCFTWQVPGEEPGIMHAEDLRALPTIRDYPTLLVWGMRDRAVHFASAEPLRRNFRDARLVAFEGVGHLPYEEAPQEFAAALIEFLTANRAL